MPAIRYCKNGQQLGFMALKDALEAECDDEVACEMNYVDGTWWHPRDKAIAYVLTQEGGKWLSMTVTGDVYLLEVVNYDFTSSLGSRT